MSVDKVIIMNKPFLGGWLDDKGNIGHEIIDFLSTDKGECYVYNNPYGVCPEDVWVQGSQMLRWEKEKYIAKYMVLTSNTRGGNFDILYVIELREKLHRFRTKRSYDSPEFRQSQEGVRRIIRDRDIKYNGKYLDEIYVNDDSLYLTFSAKKVYKAEIPIFVEGMNYNYQRNKGYLYSDKQKSDYQHIESLIERSIKDGSLETFNPRPVNTKQIGELHKNSTFLDLIRLGDNEQVFTNILYSLLVHGDMIKRFCDNFKAGNYFSCDDDFDVFRESGVVDGRVDVCAESENQRIIIENKIYSGLNGVKPADNKTQLSTYFEWARKKPQQPLCFIIIPDYRIGHLKREIDNLDPDMRSVYTIIKYSEIAHFIKEEYEQGNISSTYTYYSLINQIIDSFKNLSYSTMEDFYSRMFLDATTMVK
ncbi:PD-(D/E)XK nuclease family protein [Mycoplasmatota bacterium zrk1]